MSVSNPKRLFLCTIAILIGTSAFASHPSPRTLGRLVYDQSTHVAVLFGGRGRADRGTGLEYGSNETWFWTNRGWEQRFPATTPPERSAHSMTFDPNHRRVLMFGGRQEPTVAGGSATLLPDLWAFENNDWTLLAGASPSGPSPRLFSGLAYDPQRDVIVVFGGHEFQPLKPKQKNPDLGPVFDTWEFANGAWTRTTTGEPKVAKPLMAWDPIAKNVVMLGVDTAASNAPVMYRYANGTWTKETPAKMPTCINEGYLMVQGDGRLLFLGGICSGSTTTPPEQELFQYENGTWTELTIGASFRGIGQAVTYDTARDRVISFGGTSLASSDPLSTTLILNEYRLWRTNEIAETPEGRSWPVFETDPLGRGVVLYGGLSEHGGTYNSDSWALANAAWTHTTKIDFAPASCTNPFSTVDTDRNRLIMLCEGTTIWEFDGTDWKDFGTLTPQPDQRRFGAISYDPKLKKVVLFGGFYNNNYRNDTWTWDGTKWAELDIDNDDRPPHRSNHVMWYDAAQQKTLLYAGVGRPNLNSKVTRFADMWSFDGTRWTKLNVTQTPGRRFTPIVAVNPTTGKLLLFGGLLVEDLDADSIRQVYANDTWEWDGASSTWTQLNPEHRPPVRQNGGMAWDPVAGHMVLFGGWAKGFSHSDLWAWNGTDWRPVQEPFTGPKRRSVR
ncbi:MAG TPA: kelch repeat-containing protein [Thermoanaerobaculia bacterium]|jgi:hypothetical protein